MDKKIDIKEISPALTMVGWDLYTYFKKRKKGFITVIGAGVASWIGISNLELVNILLGLGLEMIFSVCEYYFKKVD